MTCNCDHTRMVYSTESDGRCPSCGRPLFKCACGKDAKRSVLQDGVVRIRREVKGRGGKTVTTVSGLSLSENNLKDLASELKRKCGTGGSVKEGIILIQGDKRSVVFSILKEKGYQVKLAGG